MAKKPRKWSNLAGQVPQEPVQVDAREQAIRDAADQLRLDKTPMKTLAENYAALVEEEEFEDLAKKARSIKYEAHERVILEELGRVEELSGQDMWRGAGQTFSPKFSPVPIVTDKATLLEWIRTNHREDLLDVSFGRLRNLIGDALDSDLAVTMTPAQRANLKPGDPASGQPPPGVSVFYRKGVHRTAPRIKPLPDPD